MMRATCFVLVFLATSYLFPAVSACFGGLTFERPSYAIAEDIGDNNFAVRVCVRSADNCSCNFLTNAGTAIAFEDFEPINETLALRSNAVRPQCVAIIIYEDEDPEDDEQFEVLAFEAASGSLLNRTTVTISDDDSFDVVYIADTPRVIGSSLTLIFELGALAVQATCEVFYRERSRPFITTDCTSGNVTFDITPRRSRNHVVRITAAAADGRTLIVNRRFRLGTSSRRCTTHLTNGGVVVDGDDVSIDFGLSAPAGTDSSFRCSLEPEQEGIPRGDCTSPFVASDLEPGDYTLEVQPNNDGGCRRSLANEFDFTILPQ